MEPEGRQRAIYEEATESLPLCASDERLSYIRLRAAELMVEPPRGGRSLGGRTRELATDLAGAFPSSAGIATIRARIEGSVDLARKAVALDPCYEPAKVALAAALLASSDLTGAQVATAGVNDLPSIDDAYAVDAQIKLAAGDIAGALKAADCQMHAREALRVEPGGLDFMAGIRAEAVLGIANLREGNYPKAARHFWAA